MTVETFSIFHMVKNSIFDFWYSKNKENQFFVDEDFFGMSSYICKNFRDDIPNIVEARHKLTKSALLKVASSV